MTINDFIFHFFTVGIFIYSLVLFSFYIFIGVYSTGEIKKYLRLNSFTDFRIPAASEHLPGISVVAPAYNEAANIVENVRSMLSIHYNTLELIIVNDGSKDDSLQKLIEAYDLYKANIFINEQIPTQKVKGIYKSNNPVFKKLLVVDKENGGKADALNVGINVSSYEYFVCVDVDCILEQDALLKMIKPFLEETKVRVIASGGVIRIANDCKIENGKLIEVRLPKKFLPRMQTLEYIRSFLLGRMAWSRLNGLLLISGAFGAFDKEIVIKCGGYSTETVGEDMELIVRMRRYMEEHKLAYKITYIPDPLCWTEAPINYKILGRQRNRWTRGTIETLRTHRKMFFNPKYRLLGMVSYPYWFFFEQLAPLIEFAGVIVFIIFAFLGMVSWSIFFILLGCVLLFGFLFSVFAILMEVHTYNQYKSEKDNFKLIATAFLEPFIFHPFIVWSAIQGHIDYFKKKNSWGEMTRQGLTPGQQKAVENTNPIQQTKVEPLLVQGIRESVTYSLLLFGCMLLVKVVEIIRDSIHFGAPKDILSVIKHGLINDVSFDFNIAIFPVTIFLLFYLINKKVARFFFITFSVLLIMVHAALAEYFLQTLVPLGADLFGYSIADIKQTVGAAGVSTIFIFIAIILLASVIFLFIYLPKKIKIKPALALPIIGLFILGAFGSIATVTNKWKPGSEFSNSMALNKSFFFYNNCYQSFFPAKAENLPFERSSDDPNNFKYVNEKAYPFLHTVDSTDVLSPFFNKAATKPNFIFLVVEGLGRAFSNQDAYLGSFTPFIDSLSNHSLYWSNFLSEGGRTFAMLPSIYASLPFGKNGFLELGNQMPAHLSLFNILKENGYTCNFFYGGDASFDNMGVFVKMDGGNVFDEKTFSSDYIKMPKSESGFTWGYGDDQVLSRVNEENSKTTGPVLDAVMTLSTHSPFLVNGQDKFLQQFEQRMQELNFTEAQKEEHRRYKDQYATILYLDNSIRDFINNYRKKPGFQNTVFVITGDHRMPEIPMSTKIDRYHVPLIIYSPMLKRAQKFKAVNTHYDITPSLLMLLKHQYHFKIPEQATWMGSGLDTAHEFRNIHAYPLMQTKNDIVDFIMDEYMLHNDELYKISDKMYLDPVDDKAEKAKLKAAFASFKEKNESIVKGAFYH
jgi:cellulose synthase/poly-beta-1,6-N-acetylglucosamine synthase-like glycosyltransferase/phosphoglycerol transferase MdoB-like AlkP superfamily enzyme